MVIVDTILTIVLISRGYIMKDIILLFYVDDMLVVGSNMQDINVLKRKLAKSFAMKDLGIAKQILGIRITRDNKNHKLTLSRGEYIEKVLERIRM